MKKKHELTEACLLVLFLKLLSFAFGERQSCYDINGKAMRCYPEFINAAHSQPVIVTNTCGEFESEFCVQTNIYASNDYGDNRLSKCDVCDARRREKSHPAEYLTDYNSKSNLTWWQSDTMENGIQHPNSVNLTIHLGNIHTIIQF